MSSEITPTPDTILETKQLAVGYPGRTILEDVDIEIPRGKITALIGANGSGKSTLLKTLAKSLPMAKGAALLDGQEIQKIGRRDFAKQLASLPQTPIAPEGLTVRELCRFGRHPHRGFAGRRTAEDEQIVSESLEQAGMTELADHLVDELSGGQRQRAWIAMALAQRTDVLLLDEPTTYLDIAHQTDVLRLLRELNRNYGCTIVMVLHDLNQAAKYADYLIAVADGKVAAMGCAEDVIVEETVEEVFGLRCAVIPNPLDGSPLCLPRD